MRTKAISASTVVIVSLLLSVPGCSSSQDRLKANALMAEGNTLVEREARVTQEWTGEYGKAFAARNRAEFPSNREVLRVHAKNIIKLLGQSAALRSEAAAKYEEASRLLADGKEKQFATLLASSFRKDVEATELLKEQVGLVDNDEINDKKTFNERFMNLAQRIEQKVKERDAMQAEVKTIIGYK